MKWASAVSLEADSATAVADVVAAIGRDLGGASADLAVLFVSPHHGESYGGIGAAIASELDGAVLVGCSGGGVIGAGREVEGVPSVSLTVGCLPGVTVSPIESEIAELPESASREEWCAALSLGSDSPDSLILLPDPFTFDAESVLARLDRAFPETTIVGGLASGAMQPGSNGLFVAGKVRRSGVVGVALEGDIRVDSVVAQGCRPIGEPMFVSGSDGNTLRQLDGQPAFEILRELVDSLAPEDLALARQSLLVGLVMRRNREQYGPGDFLIRNLIGVDPESGAVGVGGAVEDGAVLQFHLRDAAASAADLSRMLDNYRGDHREPPAAALMFSCLGRGEGLYGVANHDSEMLIDRVGAMPLGGFFCNGEIGPVQGKTYLHGYTNCVALIRSGGEP